MSETRVVTPWGTVVTAAFLGSGTLFVSVPFGFFSLYMLNDMVTWRENVTFAVVVLAPAVAAGLAYGRARRQPSDVAACALAAPAVPLLLGPIWVFTILPFDLGGTDADTTVPNALLSLVLVAAGATLPVVARRALGRG